MKLRERKLTHLSVLRGATDDTLPLLEGVERLAVSIASKCVKRAEVITWAALEYKCYDSPVSLYNSMHVRRVTHLDDLINFRINFTYRFFRLSIGVNRCTTSYV